MRRKPASLWRLTKGLDHGGLARRRISYSHSIIVLKTKKLTIDDIKNSFEVAKNDFKINKLILQQKTNKIKLKILNIKSTYKYKILKTIIGKPY